MSEQYFHCKFEWSQKGCLTALAQVVRTYMPPRVKAIQQYCQDTSIRLVGFLGCGRDGVVFEAQTEQSSFAIKFQVVGPAGSFLKLADQYRYIELAKEGDAPVIDVDTFCEQVYYVAYPDDSGSSVDLHKLGTDGT